MNALNETKRLVGLDVRMGSNPIGHGVGDSNHHHNNSASASSADELKHCNETAIDSDTSPNLTAPCIATIEGATPPSPSKAPFTRGHRRRSTHVTRRDLEKFQKEVLGVESFASWCDEDSGTSRPFNPYDSQLEELNRAFALANISMNSAAGMSGNSASPSMFSYTDNSPNTPNTGSISRQPMSPAFSHPPGQINGGGVAAMNGGMTMNAGFQMDLHHLYEMVLELSEVLKNNREMTKNIVSSAEEIMVRCIQRLEEAIPELTSIETRVLR